MNKKKINRKTNINAIAKCWNNFYVRHGILAVLTITILIFGTLLLLNIISRHGQTYAVPDFSNMRPADAALLAENSSVMLVVDDSIYTVRKPRGVIVEQNPKPNTRVKKNRKIFVRVNAQNIRKTTAPRVVDVSLRQARAMLESRGLAVGRLTFTPDLAHGIVLSQSYAGRPLAAGTRLPIESRIDLEIGQNGSHETFVPTLKGLSVDAARSVIIEAMLNAGREIYDSSVENITDSLNAVVYAQFPSANDAVPLGTRVDIMLTLKIAETEAEE
jgi:beta-lactam-binding protein with PASTA domain